MANPIKYNVSTETLALNKGNWWIGTGDVGKGPTSETGFYNGITPTPGGYVVYLNKTFQGPVLYDCADDAALIDITCKISGNSFSTVNECLNYYAGQTDKMVTNREYENIVTDGLVYNMDAGFVPSYPRNGSTAYDIGGNGYNADVLNSTGFNSANGGYWDLDGSDDKIQIPHTSYWNSNVFGSANVFSIMCWTKCDNFYNWTSMIHKSNGGYYSQSEGASLWVNSSGYQAVFGNGISGNSGNWGNIISYPTSNTTDWFHLAFTGDGTTLRFYVNGSQHNSQGQSSRSAGLNITSNPVSFGVRGGSAYYNGKIALALLYDKAISADQVLQNYNAQKTRFGH